MTGICFFFESSDVDVWSGHNLDAWNYAVQMAGDIKSMIVINKTDQIINTPNINLDFNVVNRVPELSGNIAKLAPEWECINGVSLWNFDHNVDWYMFGPATEPWSGNVFIPQANRGALHSIHAASIVLAHRYGVLNGS